MADRGAGRYPRATLRRRADRQRASLRRGRRDPAGRDRKRNESSLRGRGLPGRSLEAWKALLRLLGGRPVGARAGRTLGSPAGQEPCRRGTLGARTRGGDSRFVRRPRRDERRQPPAQRRRADRRRARRLLRGRTTNLPARGMRLLLQALALPARRGGSGEPLDRPRSRHGTCPGRPERYPQGGAPHPC